MSMARGSNAAANIPQGTLNASQRVLAEVLAAGSSSYRSAPSRKRRRTKHDLSAEGAVSSAATAVLSTGKQASASASTSAGHALEGLDEEAASTRLASHLGRVHDGTALVLINTARQRPMPAPASKDGRQLRKRDQRVIGRMKDDVRRGAKRKVAPPPASEQTDTEEDGGKAVGKKRRGFLDKHAHLSHASLKPLSSLWASYVHQILGFCNDTGALNPVAVQRVLMQDETGAWTVRENALTGLQTTLSKVDLTGATVRVIRCSDPARVGLQGLVARETENTLLVAVEPAQLASPSAGTPTPRQAEEALRQRRPLRPPTNRRASKDVIRVVPKHNTVFELLIPLPALPTSKPASSSTASEAGPTLTVPLYGNQMSQSFPTRATRKHKARKTVDF